MAGRRLGAVLTRRWLTPEPPAPVVGGFEHDTPQGLPRGSRVGQESNP